MISIDKLSYISKLRKVNPMEKFIFAILTMLLSIYLNNILISIIVIILMGFITVYKGKIPFSSYLVLMLIPLGFLIVGVITIAINIGDYSSHTLFGFSIFNIRFGCTQESIIESAKVLFRSLAAVSCLYFLSLSTPIVELLSVLKKLKVPKLFVELMSLIYRFIFIFLETVNLIYISQDSRLGYSNLKTGYNSLGKLIGSLFLSSYKRSQDMYNALESRCYEGDINVIENNYKISYVNLVMILFLEVFLIFLAINENTCIGVMGGVIWRKNIL
ncbi:cobalt ECF transporter T component CbiQ [Clostridium estertheticum]|uniref:cobalt ECF transporter T component CbiQ n=1 Tax=Clostridium estertheticum TaxID=238834 RepID=UPI0013E95036|nr:cobalt ECF transporter T component CbiQ [Clostridium estertheticum]MBZ9687095.1 cobalt ECF transporter T component CbiQ [Clostridium estertheticum]